MHHVLFIAPDGLQLSLEQPDEVGRLDHERDVPADGRQPGAQLVALAEEADGAAVDLGDVPVAEREAVRGGRAGRQTVARRQALRQHLRGRQRRLSPQVPALLQRRPRAALETVAPEVPYFLVLPGWCLRYC